MTTSSGEARRSAGSSRYESGPVGGPDDGTGSQPAPYGQTPPAPGTGTYGETPPAPHGGGTGPAPGYGGDPGPGKPGYGGGPDPSKPGYGGGPGPGTPDEPAEPGGGFGPDDPGYDDCTGPKPPPTPPPPSSHPCPPSSKTCDTSSVDDLQCRAAAVKAESDKLAEVAEGSAARRIAFNKARSDYAKARDAAVLARKVGETPEKKGLDDRIDSLLNDKHCKLNLPPAVVACIDTAFGQVLDCLDECGENQGCCAGQDCDFTSQSWTVGQIEDLRTRVDKCKSCFDTVLVVEPDKLTERVAVLTAKVDALEAAYGTVDEATIDEEKKKHYAGAKEARWMLDTLWGAFADVNAYQDCLCRGFTCLLKGHAWLAELEGQKKYKECQEDSRKRRCTELRQGMVEETLATELVLCPPKSEEGDAPAGSEPAAT